MLCMHTMCGTRDMISSLIRLRPQWEHSSHAEIDMRCHQCNPAFFWVPSQVGNEGAERQAKEGCRRQPHNKVPPNCPSPPPRF